MYLTLEEDKNSDIKSWLNQGVEDFDKCFSQPKDPSREVEIKCESSKPSQKFQSIYNQKNLQSRLQSRGLSKSPRRKEKRSGYFKAKIQHVAAANLCRTRSQNSSSLSLYSKLKMTFLPLHQQYLYILFKHVYLN